MEDFDIDEIEKEMIEVCEQIEEEERKYTCELCFKVLATNRGLLMHKRLMHTVKDKLTKEQLMQDVIKANEKIRKSYLGPVVGMEEED